jgi:IclR family acetate operon transcriptional repressor
MTLRDGDGVLSPRTIVKSADRALDVIECVAAAAAPLTFTQILRALNVPKSSLSQLLTNLVNRHYLDLDPAINAYRLGPGLLGLVERAASSVPVRTLVDPFLQRLRDELNETAGYYVHEGDEVARAAAATSRHALVYIMNVGERAPLYAISPGKVMLADMSEEGFEKWLRSAELRSFTKSTIVDPATLRRQIAKVRESGFAYADQEFTLGIKGIACAVRSRGQFFGSVNISVPVARFDAELDRAARAELAVAADHIARALTRRLGRPSNQGGRQS